MEKGDNRVQIDKFNPYTNTKNIYITYFERQRTLIQF